ncbi:MAG: YraN family protein [Alphaproteobacteria bacterium]|nr:YraN family protein [Alphaproteobacteria bacterium]
MTRKMAEQRGHWGERRAALWLRLKGWRIVGQRVRVAQGEVDIIARRGRTLAFIEVKTRKNAADLDTAIDAYRLRRVAAAAQALVHKYARASESIRIDVILIAPGAWPRHLKNVWMETQ